MFGIGSAYVGLKAGLWLAKSHRNKNIKPNYCYEKRFILSLKL